MFSSRHYLVRLTITNWNISRVGDKNVKTYGNAIREGIVAGSEIFSPM